MTILSSDIVGYPANLDLQDFVAGAVFGEVGG